MIKSFTRHITRSLRCSLTISTKFTAPSYYLVRKQPLHTFSRFFSTTPPAQQEASDIIAEAYDALNAQDVQQAFDKFQSVLDRTSVSAEDKSQALVGLASTFTVQGQTDQAISYLHQAQGVLKAGNIQDKTVLSHLYYLLGRNYRQVGRLDDALNYAERAVKFHQEGSGEEDSKLGLMLYNIGAIYRHKKNLDKAKSNFLRAINCFYNSDTNQDTELSFLYYDLGFLLIDKGDYGDAAVYLEKASKMLEDEGDASKIFMGELYFHAGKAYEGTQNVGEAEKKYLRVVELADLEVSDLIEKTQIADLLSGAGEKLLELEKPKEALKPLEKALSIYEELGGHNAASIANISHHLGIIYGFLEDREKSVSYLRKAVQSKVKTLGQNHLEVAFAYQSLGASLLSMGRGDESKECLTKAYVIFQRSYGDSHPICKETQSLLEHLESSEKKE